MNQPHLETETENEINEIVGKKSLKSILSKLIKSTYHSISRFFTTFCFIVILFLAAAILFMLQERVFTFALAYYGENHRWLKEFLQKLMIVSVFGIMLCTLGMLLFERYKSKIKIKKIYINIILFVVSCSAYVPLIFFYDNRYVDMAYVGVITALFICTLFFLIKESISKTFSYMFKCIMFNVLICGVIHAGIAICVSAFSMLILDIDFWMMYRVNTVIALFIWIVLFLNLSLTAIPNNETQLGVPKAFKIIVLYAMLPIYMLLMTILYIYLARVLITLEFPSGEINPIASVASLLFIFFVLSLEHYRKEIKVADIFVRFAGYMIIPVIAMQFWAIYIRVSAYGLTSMRYVSIVLNIIALTFAIISLVKRGRFIKYILLVMAGTALIITITPLNAVDVPVRSQTSRLISLLNENDMIENGNIIPNEDVSREDKIEITSAYLYISRSGANMPPILFGLEEKSFEEIFGFERTFARRWGGQDLLERRFGTFECNCHREEGLEVAGFDRIYFISGNNANVCFETSDGTITYDISDIIMELYNEHGLSYGVSYCEKIIINIGDNRLVLNRVRFSIDNNGVLEVTAYSGFFLVR